jgi:uncharacterized protein YecE (DUF72 family)
MTSGVAATAPSVTGLHVGTSGFSYASWRPGFYPEGTPPEGFLRAYAQRLPAVELLATYHRLPSEEQLRRWAEQTPPSFRFAVRAPRRIGDGRVEALPTFAERIGVLGERLGPVTIRFADGRPRDDGSLALLLGSLDPALRWAFDFRHESWLAPEVDDALAAAGAVRVGDLEAAAPFRYLRLRDTPYDDAALAARAERLRPLLAAGVEVWCFFRHEAEPAAPRYAAWLLEALAGGA